VFQGRAGVAWTGNSNDNLVWGVALLTGFNAVGGCGPIFKVPHLSILLVVLSTKEKRWGMLRFMIYKYNKEISFAEWAA
jgi:hypothetical protein